MIIKQRTISKEVEIEGIGLHTGKISKMKFLPAPENHGFKFVRADLEGKPVVSADCRYVVDTSRGTTIEQNGAKVYTVEHTLAALVGLEIDNVIIELNGPEPPILDGSSILFINLLETAGIVEQEAERDYFEVTTAIKFRDEEKDAEFILFPADDYQITAMVDYKSQVLGTQHASLDGIENFKSEIASCRTFCFLHELIYLSNNNLIKGGDLSNAIVIADTEVSQKELDDIAKLLNKPSVRVKQGILNNIELQYQNEPARHKILDIVGDLALAGMPIKGHVIATKPGHASNVLFAKKLQELIKDYKKKKTIPKYDPNKAPIFDVNKIMEWLPHRYPFVMVDKIIEMNETRVVGVKSVSYNEFQFPGHFPGNPVMPGVLIIEAMAQTGGILALSLMEEPNSYWTYFSKIEHAKFKDRVVPGDTMIISLELLEPIRRGIVLMGGHVYVGERLVTEAQLMATLVKKS